MVAVLNRRSVLDTAHEDAWSRTEPDRLEHAGS